MSDAFWTALGAVIVSLASLSGTIYLARLARSINSKVDGILGRSEERTAVAREETTISRQETADARVAGAEGAGLAQAAGVEQERVRAAGEPAKGP